MPDYNRLAPWSWGFIWLALIGAALSFRPLLPVDETRYVTVAWEMWLRQDFLVPHLNGATYSHKPPLLFWLINAGWGIFGVNDWWPRLVAPLFGLGSLALSSFTCRRLWPQSQAFLIVPILLIGTFYWGIYTSLTMFDLIITFWTLIGINGLLDVWQGKRLKGWLLFSLAIGFGVLSKGPVILVYLIPVAIAAPYWARGDHKLNWGSWYLGILGSIALGAAIALAWAIPAGFAGGEEYRNAIFWGQSAGRMVQSFAHREPFWWYLAILPGLLLPWILWPSLIVKVWHKIREGSASTPDPGLRLLLIWAVATFVIFSAISGKRPHYLLPMFPSLAMAGALLIAQMTKNDFIKGRWDIALPTIFIFFLAILIGFAPEVSTALKRADWSSDINQIWALPLIGLGFVLIIKPPQGGYRRLFAIAATSSIFVISTQGILHSTLTERYDLKPISNYLAQAQQEGYAIGHYGKYHGQFHFLGKLEKPIFVTGSSQVKSWLLNKPKAKIVGVHEKMEGDRIKGLKPDFVQKYRRRYIAVWDRSQVMADPNIPNRSQ